MPPITTPFDGAIRRRIHLMRHAEADYARTRGEDALDPNDVPLTERGRGQAAAMRDATPDVVFDFALCSGLPRTRETAQIVLADRALELREEPRLIELQSGRSGGEPLSPAQIAYAFHEAGKAGATFAGGEEIASFCRRVVEGFEHQLEAGDWQRALFVCHGGVNRAILMWALECGPEVLANFEQDNACMNVIDVDCHPETGEVVRRYLRSVNWTPYDPAKRDIHLTTLETSASLMAARS